MKVNNDFAICPFTVVVDTAEKAPYGFAEIPPRSSHGSASLVVQTVRKYLTTGDYSIEGFEDKVSVERKSLEDLFSTLGQHRKRFEAEFERLESMDRAAVVVEATWQDVCRPKDPRVLERLALDTLQDAFVEYGTTGVLSEDTGVEALGKLADMLFEAWEKLEVQDKAQSGWRSRLNPRSVWGTIFSWSHRYPGVHWYCMGSRRLAELATFEILERFWREEEDGDSR